VKETHPGILWEAGRICVLPRDVLDIQHQSSREDTQSVIPDEHFGRQASYLAKKEPEAN
jgi:hypothetical protein